MPAGRDPAATPTRRQQQAHDRDRELRRRMTEYDRDLQRMRDRLHVAAAPENGLFEITGWVRETLTRAQALAADLDDHEVSKLLAAQVRATNALGQLLARRRATNGGPT